MEPQPPFAIRPHSAADIEPLYEAIDESRAELAPWMPWCTPAYTAADSRIFVDGQVAAFAAGTEFGFTVTDAAGRVLGDCALNHIDKLNRYANLGYWVRSSCTGRGVASQAGRLLVQWGFANTELNRIEILAAVGNGASQRVAERIGAVREGVLRNRLFLGGRSHDGVLYSVTREQAAAVPLAATAPQAL
jgi:RimJ/RimL family protein N-acetyltransferase